ncbi:hypothetical protein RAD15_14720 [Bradyrhizobium sp. 14AA]
MKTVALIVAAILILIPASTSVQAQTASSTATKKDAKQPQAKNLPRCSRAMQMAGKPCYGG